VVGRRGRMVQCGSADAGLLREGLWGELQDGGGRRIWGRTWSRIEDRGIFHQSPGGAGRMACRGAGKAGDWRPGVGHPGDLFATGEVCRDEQTRGALAIPEALIPG